MHKAVHTAPITVTLATVKTTRHMYAVAAKRAYTFYGIAAIVWQGLTVKLWLLRYN